MKRKLIVSGIVTVLIFAASYNVHATTHIIMADSASFTPDSMKVMVGDTIIWSWVAGAHTISANGIPFGAEPFNVLLDSGHKNFTYIIHTGGFYHYISVPDAPGMTGTFNAIPFVGLSSLNASGGSLLVAGNPASQNIHVLFAIPEAGHITMSLISISGSVMQVLEQGEFPAGTYDETFPLEASYAPGIYLVSMQVGNSGVAAKVVIR